MYTRRNYPTLEVLLWTRRDVIALLIIAAVPTVAYAHFGLRQIGLPWLPIALLGTAVAFVVSFKNNASYDRLWEARRIWGSIVNTSRAWGMMTRDYVSDRHCKSAVSEETLAAARRTLIDRHVAWLTALRYQLREARGWESISRKHNAEFRDRWYRVEEQDGSIAQAIEPFLTKDEHTRVMASANKAVSVLALQSAHLAELLKQGLIEDFRHMELGRLLAELAAHQGGSERIKNFPYPRQYATLNLWFVKIFVFLIPLGMVPEFDKLGGNLVWLAIPFSALSGWVFTTLEKIGDSTENPFEGSPNDVPITTMSRAIEIDLRQMIGETVVPPPIPAQHDIMI